jgi:hypothetical protein
VYDAIEDVRGDIPTNVQAAIADGEYSTTTGFFNKVKQTNGKVSVEEKDFDIVVDDTTGRNTDTAPTTQAVHQALWKKQDKSNADYQIGMANGVWQTLNDAEKAALQSGISADKVAAYEAYATTKQNTLEGAQLDAVNSGITADKEVKDDATYQALKNDPDWFTQKLEYSRYNHDSAVATINSLPDTSAYLATAGGTNTIKFKGAAGSATDGGAINTLTEEEIAVAIAKGWTVTLV